MPLQFSYILVIAVLVQQELRCDPPENRQQPGGQAATGKDKQMQEWWTNLAGPSQIFYGIAVFSSVFFLWQMIAAFAGMDGDDVDGDIDGADLDTADDLDDAGDSSQAFKLLSLRSIVTFFTLFSWGSALYTTQGMPAARAMGISSIWGLAGMFSIAVIFYFMGKLSETGTKNLATCKGEVGTVYLDIPAGGFGEVRILISGAMEHVKAQCIDGEALPAGTQIRVAQVVDQTLVTVEKIIEKGE